MPAVDVAEKLVAFADLGVYDAKNAGRNQVKARLFEASVDAMMAP
jgi:PleD family two-component response regulator